MFHGKFAILWEGIIHTCTIPEIAVIQTPGKEFGISEFDISERRTAFKRQCEHLPISLCLDLSQ